MINIKNEEEIRKMKEGGLMLSEVFREIEKQLKPGMRLVDLDELAEREILRRNAYPSFKKVEGYSHTICACVNDVVVHGIPGGYILKSGDEVGIDCGVYYKGFHTDAAWTYYLSKEQENTNLRKFLDVGKKALVNAIRLVKEGNYIYDISKSIQETVEESGYSVVRSLIGHGVGRELHEEPEVPGFTNKERERTVRLMRGLTIAIEVIYNMGSSEVCYKRNDGWTISTKDGKISGLFEATVVVDNHGCIILTPLPGLEKVTESEMGDKSYDE